jgi:hypothetical protein
VHPAAASQQWFDQTSQLKMFATVAQLYDAETQEASNNLARLYFSQLYDPMDVDFTQSYYDKSDIAGGLAVCNWSFENELGLP